MTDEQLVEAATAKLLGEFYLGQAVRVTQLSSSYEGRHGVITELPSESMPFHYGVRLVGQAGGEQMYFLRDALVAL